MHGYCSEPAMLPSESPSTVTVSLSNATNRPSLATTVTTTCGEEEDMLEESEFNLSWIRHAEDQDHIQSEHPYHHQYLPHHLPHQPFRHSIDSGITNTSASSSSSVNSLVYEQSSIRKNSDSSTKLQWSLKSLRTEFKLKNTEIHFRRYQLRLNHRLFTVLMILNIVVSVFDAAWIAFFKVG